MPNIGFYHPIIVHFVIALLYVGVAFRLVSLTGKFQFTNLAALTLILIGTLAAVLAVQSGQDAHGAVERIPGLRSAVGAHEDWAHDARNAFLVVSLIEILAFAFASRSFHRILLFASGLAGAAACVVLFIAADKGGDIVYEYAGGPGLRSGDSTDISRLYLAGLYNEAMLERKSGQNADAAALVDQMAKRFPGDTTVRLLAIESLIVDKKDGKGALVLLTGFTVPADGSRFLRFRTMLLKADAYQAAGFTDSARAVLQGAPAEFQSNPQVKNRLEKLK
ncbi:MAG TPA: DUF2231 domain-containing protein [Gemmatimonadales bacterium]|nr:DUF2231 domain-containing protein [Gemmatimonadales bacterium]